MIQVIKEHHSSRKKKYKKKLYILSQYKKSDLVHHTNTIFSLLTSTHYYNNSFDTFWSAQSLVSFSDLSKPPVVIYTYLVCLIKGVSRLDQSIVFWLRYLALTHSLFGAIGFPDSEYTQGTKLHLSYRPDK